MAHIERSYDDRWAAGEDVVTELEAELERLRAALDVAADSCERDRREADKILCHVLTMRRAVNHVSG